MARQAGPIFFTGTLDDITFYKMDGQYLARKKSSLTRKQFKTDPRFARSRKSAAAFGEASKLASSIYPLLPKEVKKKGAFGQLTQQVGHLLREGKPKEEVQEILLAHYQPLTYLHTTIKAAPSANKTLPGLTPRTIIAPGKTGSKLALTKPAPHIKQARYLSNWKVKRNGQLLIPWNITAVDEPKGGLVEGSISNALCIYAAAHLDKE